MADDTPTPRAWQRVTDLEACCADLTARAETAEQTAADLADQLAALADRVAALEAPPEEP